MGFDSPIRKSGKVEKFCVNLLMSPFLFMVNQSVDCLLITCWSPIKLPLLFMLHYAISLPFNQMDSPLEHWGFKPCCSNCTIIPFFLHSQPICWLPVNHPLITHPITTAVHVALCYFLAIESDGQSFRVLRLQAMLFKPHYHSLFSYSQWSVDCLSITHWSPTVDQQSSSGHPRLNKQMGNYMHMSNAYVPLVYPFRLTNVHSNAVW